MHEPLAIPARVDAAHEGWRKALARSQIPEVVTWRLARGEELRFVKVAAIGWEPSLAAERDRLVWAAHRLPVATVLDYGTDGRVEWLLTEGLPGKDATHSEFCRDPASLVPLLAAGLVEPERDFHEEHRHLTAGAALDRLESHRPSGEDLVLCHGDYCLPNVLIDNCRVCGYVDLGELGLADRWWDLAVATWSLTWNLGPGWEETFLAAYGVELDPERTDYYRLLYDLLPDARC